MSTLSVDGRTSLANAARRYCRPNTPRSAPPDLDALLILLRATLVGIGSAERPLDPPDRRKQP